MVTREFLAERKTGVGGSDAPIILGVSKWSSLLQLWASKVQALEEDIRAEDIDEETAEELTWGRLVEPIVLEQFQKKTGRGVIHQELFVRHPEINWLIGHADGKELIHPEGSLGILECKNVSKWIWMEWFEDAPLPVKIQIQHYLAAFDLEYATAVALIGGNKMVWHDVQRNQPFIDAMLEEEERFWARVVSDNPPPATAADCKFLNKLVPEAPGLVISMPTPGLTYHEELEGVKNEIEKIEEQLAPLIVKKEEFEAKLKQQIGEASEVTLPDGSGYSFKSQTRKEHTVKETTFRTLRFKKAR